jgi:hypothetical protein
MTRTIGEIPNVDGDEHDQNEEHEREHVAQVACVDKPITTFWRSFSTTPAERISPEGGLSRRPEIRTAIRRRL